jgi:hypothetical protein
MPALVYRHFDKFVPWSTLNYIAQNIDEVSASPSEAYNHSASQEIAYLSWEPKVNCDVDKSRPLVS